MFSYVHDGKITKKQASLLIKFNGKESIHFINLLVKLSIHLPLETKISTDPTEPENKIIYLIGSDN